ncbi:hypothetical protein C8R44DRAFT_823365, partial [Mycena epipterygia]
MSPISPLRRTTAPRSSRTVSAPPPRVASHSRAHPSSWIHAPPRVKWCGGKRASGHSSDGERERWEGGIT